jgi:hypothetical protein
MKTLILNSQNLKPNSGNSVFVYEFPRGSFVVKDDYIAIAEISMYWSAFNITSAYRNNQFSYTWVDGSVHQVIFPDGYYEVSQINEFLQFTMIQNGHYLIASSSGDFVYLLEMVINSSQYAVQINNYVISSALATTNGWTLPASPTWALPTSLILPYITIPSNNEFGLLIGYTAGQYPAGTITGTPPAQVQTPAFTSAQSELSDLAPQITPYSSVLVFCSLVNNSAVVPSQLLFSFTPTDAGFGTLQNFKTYEFAWNKCSDGAYTQFTIEFRDQLGRALVFEDPNTLITLCLKNREDDF